MNYKTFYYVGKNKHFVKIIILVWVAKHLAAYKLRKENVAKKDLTPIVKEVLKFVGGDENVSSFTNCQTRLRINVKDVGKVNKQELQKLEGTIGVGITGDQVQIIYGPGVVIRYADAFSKITTAHRGEAVDASKENLKDIAAAEKAKTKAKNTSSIQKFIGKFANIFAPMIIGFIGAGILAGIGGIIQGAAFDFKTNHFTSATAESWFNVLSILLNIWKATFLIIVGWRTAEVFGGSGVIGAIIAGLYVAAFAANVGSMFVAQRDAAGVITHYNFLGARISDPLHNWLTIGLRPNDKTLALSYPSGSVFGVMISAGIVGIIEKGIRKFMPPVIDPIGTPTIALSLLLFLNVFLIFPISGYVFTAVSFMFENLYGNPFGGALLAGLFLFTVVFGVHQGFVPVYAALLTNKGLNALYPILAMAGAGQVGMALALYFKAEKGGVLKKQIRGAIIPGILGIGEPLIYGVSLPRVKPFITACIGGACGGFFMGAMNLWVDQTGVLFTGGPSGLIIAPLMTTASQTIWKGIVTYLGGLGISYLGGFGATYLFGTKNVDLA